MKAHPGARSEPALLVFFDGGVRERVVCHRPDRYRLLETDVDARPRIARGGGCARALPRAARVQQVGWCERGELNPHGLPLWILSPARLPIPPLSHNGSIAIPAAKHIEGDHAK